MRLGIAVDLDYHFPEATDVLLAIEVAQLSHIYAGREEQAVSYTHLTLPTICSV